MFVMRCLVNFDSDGLCVAKLIQFSSVQVVILQCQFLIECMHYEKNYHFYFYFFCVVVCFLIFTR